MLMKLSQINQFIAHAGYQAVISHKVTNWFWKKDMIPLALLSARVNRLLTGVEIEPGAILSNNVSINHGMGVVIGGSSIIGENVVIRQNVTIGQDGKGTFGPKGRIHPMIEADVNIGAGAVILGPITIGKGAIIGANAVVTKDVPQYAVVAGVPGRILRYNYPKDRPNSL
jgi:serine O-acetyltransferase